ncbi:hypothetical protein B0O99DRAFT_621252 [Bisporella sp. PMI_857]|nr:hypothetical protein B0O99DRAFT_621252 [Bisporella sp. PMI_857]
MVSSVLSLLAPQRVRADTDTMQGFNLLKHLEENQRRVWLPSAPGDGGLQTKVGAFGLSCKRLFSS